MSNIDVFNGDADGLFALHQLRLTYPAKAALVTGVKRDVRLLERVQAQARPGDSVTVCDISMGQNREALTYLLNLGVQITYFDHHFTGNIARHPGLTAVLDTAPDICTSALVDRFLGGQHRAWAVAAAFGDNLGSLAARLAEPLHLSAQQLDRLRDLGECVNYNAYGDALSDLYFDPAELYRLVEPYADALRFVERESVALDKLRRGRESDLAQAQQVGPQSATPNAALYVLPEAAWSRRIRGEFANWLANRSPTRAHAVLSRNAQGGYTVSVRAPLAHPRAADALCERFATGGGRPLAAGINQLPDQGFEEFRRQFFAEYGS